MWPRRAQLVFLCCIAVAHIATALYTAGGIKDTIRSESVQAVQIHSPVWQCMIIPCSTHWALLSTRKSSLPSLGTLLNISTAMTQRPIGGALWYTEHGASTGTSNLTYRCDEGRPSAWTGTFRSSSMWGWSHPVTATAWARALQQHNLNRLDLIQRGCSNESCPGGFRISMDHLACYLRRSGPL